MMSVGDWQTVQTSQVLGIATVYCTTQCYIEVLQLGRLTGAVPGVLALVSLPEAFGCHWPCHQTGVLCTAVQLRSWEGVSSERVIQLAWQPAAGPAS
jgi:hypothetical protein